MLDIDTRLSFKLKSCISSVRSPLIILSHVRAYSRSRLDDYDIHTFPKNNRSSKTFYILRLHHETEVKKKKERERLRCLWSLDATNPTLKGATRGCLVHSGVTLPPDQSARSVASWKFCIQRASRFGTTIRPVTTYSNRIVRNRPFLPPSLPPFLPAWLSTRSRPWVESLPCSSLIPFHQHQMRHFSTSISVSLPAVHHRYLRLQSGLPERAQYRFGYRYRGRGGG